MKKRRKRIFYVKKKEFNLKHNIIIIFIINIILLALCIFSIYIYSLYKIVVFLYLYIIFIMGLIIDNYVLLTLIDLYKIKNNYYIRLRNIKKRYGNYLEHKVYNFNSKKYKKIVMAKNIDVLVDKAKKYNLKIKYFEVTAGMKCFFLFEHDGVLYKYILNKKINHN